MPQYTKVRLLGQGAHGKCYLARDEQGKKVVIKQTDMRHLDEDEKMNAVLEGKLLEAFRHPYIIQFHEVYRTQTGKLCIVMDNAGAGDLKTRLTAQNGARIPEEQIIDWFVQIALAVKHVHDRKVLHRDIKSQNIFMTETGQIKLGDFGIARTLDRTSEMADSVVGSPLYLSPEIVMAKPYNFKSDIWSMGVVLYEMCELKVPFMSNSIQGLVVKIAEGDFEPIDEFYSVSMNNLVNMCLEMDPNDRPNINTILRLPFIQERIEYHMSEELLKEEFSHSTIHKANVFELAQIAREANEKRDQPEEEKKDTAAYVMQQAIDLYDNPSDSPSKTDYKSMMQDDIREDQVTSWDNQPSEDEDQPNEVPVIPDPRPKPVDKVQLKQQLISELGEATFQEMYDNMSQVGAGNLHGANPEDYYFFFTISEAILSKHLPNVIRLIILENS